MRWAALVCVLLLVAFAGCRKEDEEQSYPWPVWIVDLYVYREPMTPDSGLQPIGGTPIGVFHVEPTGLDTLVRPARNQPNRIHLWRHIDSVATVEFYVRCTNYLDSEPIQIRLYEEHAFQGPGRDGAEVIYTDTVRLEPQMGKPQ